MRLRDSSVPVPARFIKIFLSTAILSVLWVFNPYIAQSWEGYDYDTGDCVQINDDGDLIEGKDIEFYDCSDGEFHVGSIISVEKDGGTEVEVYDNDEEQHRTFEFEEGLSG